MGIWKYRKDLEGDPRGKKKSPKNLRSVTFYTWDFGGQVCTYVCAEEAVVILASRAEYIHRGEVEEKGLIIK